MKELISFRTATWVALLASARLTWAQTAGESEVQRRLYEAIAALPDREVKQEKSENLNRISFSYRLGFDISARFQTVRGFSQILNAIPESGHATNRNYVVGTQYESYVRTDINSNQYIDPKTGQTNYATVNWGVSSLNQIHGDGTVEMSTITEVSEGSFEAQSEQLTHGLELIYNRQIGPLGRGTWGLEAAFGFDQVELRDSGGANAEQTRITDSYKMLGSAPDIFVVPPQGSFAAPAPGGWPLLADEPIPGSRTTTINTIAQAVTGNYAFDADLFGFRLGPYAEFPLGDKWHFSLSGGLALLLVDSQFSYQENVLLYPDLSSSGQGKRSDLLVGGYAAGRIHYFLSDTVNLFVGAQWQGMSKYRQSVGGKEAQLDVGGRVFFTAGVGFNF
jgi:hypothetical protein